ncbi:helix-turn-helix domain-containing protein [Fructobacillus durionis]|uniref:Helix-turn-helix n=1 Tax=Fructobacillus durionis TaxID=283737 RepID=A0A1I1EGF1_9LACO|nr:helix-turn-helix transcriptional regulator [Fructobacillus durionis]SFB84428.1 Helix-turn-helix [Fructobacillus durionis]
MVTIVVKRKEQLENKEIGNIIRQHRKVLGYSREVFISEPIEDGLLPEDWISEKSLSNIELGYNLPSIFTLKKISIALQIDFPDLITEIDQYL